MFVLPDYPLEYIVRCEATHWLIASYSGLAAYCLTSTILSRAGLDRRMPRLPLLAGCAAALTSHWLVDTFTSLA